MLAALLAGVAAIVGLSQRDDRDDVFGPKFLTLHQIGRFEQPVHLSQPPGVDSPMFVVERPGRVRVLDDGRTQREPFLDIRPAVKDDGRGGEQGLLSIAFPPDYAASGLFYVAYTDNRDALRVVEFARDPGNELRADRKSERLVLRIPQPTPKHHGGLLLFGPDKQLYIGSGDGGPSTDPFNVGQSKRSLLGKILRIDPHQAGGRPYTPEGAPSLAGQGAPEVYSYGLRNPWRFSFDRETDALVIGDVGQSSLEEIDYVPAGQGAGANFGWSAFEGDERFNEDQEAADHVPPVFAYGRESGCSVTGGYVVRDPGLPALEGRYLYGDFCEGDLRSFVPGPGKASGDESVGLDVPSLSSFAEDNQGGIYATSLEGPVFRVVQ